MAKRKVKLKTPAKIILVVLSVVLVMAIYTLINNFYQKEDSLLSSAVLQYEDQIEHYANINDISEYKDLLLAIMMQESSGSGNDPMQSSECEFNKQFDKKPGAIQDADYSIEVGVKYFAKCLDRAKCKGVTDTNNIYLALQGYNYGVGYIQYANKSNGYSYQNAIDFQERAKQEQGVDVYGDSKYVYHVLRYYPDTTLLDNWLNEYH